MFYHSFFSKNLVIMNNLDNLTLEQLEYLYDLLHKFNKLSKSDRKILLKNLCKKINDKREEQKDE